MAKNSTEETIIAQGVRVDGDFVSEGDVYIEGEVKGNVTTNSDLRLGAHSVIHADVNAKNAVMSGKVSGNVQVSGRLDLLESALLEGNITCDVLTVAAGAKINGQLNMQGGSVPKLEEDGVED